MIAVQRIGTGTSVSDGTESLGSRVWASHPERGWSRDAPVRLIPSGSIASENGRRNGSAVKARVEEGRVRPSHDWKTSSRTDGSAPPGHAAAPPTPAASAITMDSSAPLASATGCRARLPRSRIGHPAAAASGPADEHLPSFEARGRRLFRRLTLVVVRGRIDPRRRSRVSSRPAHRGGPHMAARTAVHVIAA